MNSGKSQESTRRIVLGIDPGTSTGLAALDLDGNLLFAKSEREISLDRIIHDVSVYGKTVLVTTDVTPAPALARKVASKLKAALFTPSRSMEVPEKRALVTRYNQTNAMNLSDIHAIDALASGIKALQRFKNKFKKLETEVADKVPASSQDRTKELLLKGFSIDRAIRESVRQLTPRRDTVLQPKRLEVKPDIQKTIAEKTEVIMRLDDLVKNLQEDIRKVKSEKLELTMRLERERTRSSAELRKDRLYMAQRNQIVELKKRVHELEEKLEQYVQRKTHDENLDSGQIDSDMTLLKPIEAFTAEGLEKAVERFQMEAGDPVILKDASGGGASTARALVRLRPSVVVTCTPMSYQAEEVLVQNSIPVVKSNLLSMRKVRDNSYVSRKGLESLIATTLLEETIEKCRERQA